MGNEAKGCCNDLSNFCSCDAYCLLMISCRDSRFIREFYDWCLVVYHMLGMVVFLVVFSCFYSRFYVFMLSCKVRDIGV